ncbi:zinc finger protein 668-like [Anopheles aquasalis]|uniref:zinc finger protein 668-like n=1 Tax=Anopheles aquasalis TaxID=42839 RepID=UPI00215AD193|nr:zinc finger protein 668-like [Anopheles aquasalis]
MHLKGHANGYQCDVCHKTFINNRAYLSHRDTAHKRHASVSDFEEEFMGFEDAECVAEPANGICEEPGWEIDVPSPGVGDEGPSAEVGLEEESPNGICEEPQNDVAGAEIDVPSPGVGDEGPSAEVGLEEESPNGICEEPQHDVAGAEIDVPSPGVGDEGPSAEVGLEEESPNGICEEPQNDVAGAEIDVPSPGVGDEGPSAEVGLEVDVCPPEAGDNPQNAENMVVWMCNQCDKQFNLKDSLNRHKARSHGLPKPRIRCDKCEETFVSQDSLKRHSKRKHEEPVVERPQPQIYRCSECGNEYKSADNLTRHKKVHKEPEGSVEEETGVTEVSNYQQQ